MFTYDKLWKMLIEKNFKKTDLKKYAGITPSTLAKLGKNENVSLDVLDRICTFLECDIGDIVEHMYTPYKDNDKLGTFLPNKNEHIHSWFGYLEGYSKTLVETEIEKLSDIQSIYDPFGGSGTTPLVTMLNGMNAYVSEANPVMNYIIQVKTISSFNIAKSTQKLQILFEYFEKLMIELKNFNPDIIKSDDFGSFEKYFTEINLKQIIFYKSFVETIPDTDVKNIFNIALAGITISVSKMIRRGDLRFAKGKEIEKTSKPLEIEIIQKLKTIISDLEELPTENIGTCTILSRDVRDVKEENLVDAVITSPPYLNGTNYIRNTKLELKLLDFIKTEKELGELHKTGIVAGINNVSKNNSNYLPRKNIVKLYNDLTQVAYDKRIPKMVAGYFNDMADVFRILSNVIKNDGYFIMDIGDSQFAGIHVKTHDILIEIAADFGFHLYENEIIRSRKSKSGFELTQRILRFKLKKE